MWRAGFFLAVTALPAFAADKVPAPDYFIATTMETTTAQQLARFCPTLSINPPRVMERTEATLVQMTEDGFTPENYEARMFDPTEEIAALQNAFMTKHGLSNGAATADVCAAGAAEIAAASPIGLLLLEVSE